jgi:hypothetical protein
VARNPIRSCLCSPNAFSHFPQKLKISSKMCPLWVPISLILGTFFEAFSNKWPKGSKAPPQSGHKIGKWTPWVPKCSPRVPKCSPKVTHTIPLGLQIKAPAPTGMPNSSFDRHPSIQASKHPGLRSQRSAAEAVAYKSGRGLEGRAHQAACRSPRSGAEAENRGTSSKGFVLILN